MYLLCTKGQMKTSNKFKYSLSLLKWKLKESIFAFLIDTLRCFPNELCFFKTKPKQITQAVVNAIYQAWSPSQWKPNFLKKPDSIFIPTHAKQVGICSKDSIVHILNRPFLPCVGFIKLQVKRYFLLWPGNNARFVVYSAFFIFLSLPFINK